MLSLFNSYHLLLVIFWIMYAVLHSVMAAVWFKTYVQKVFGKYYGYYRLFYSCFAALTLVLLLIYQFSQPSIFLFSRGWLLLVAGVAGTIAGMAIMIICIKKYFLNLSGVDVLLKKQITPVLEKGGLHAYIRHPLYSGTLLFVWSLFLLFPLFSSVIACVIITVYTCIGIRMEEKKLIIEFGDEYRVYASQTPMLIPSIVNIV